MQDAGFDMSDGLREREEEGRVLRQEDSQSEKRGLENEEGGCDG